MIKILIADDHPVVRKGLKDIIAEIPDITVVDEASAGMEAVDKVRKNDYDVVLLDISMPGIDGLEALKQIKGERPKLPVLILSIYPEGKYAVRVLRAGASGYLTKESTPDELIAAIRKVHLGRKYISSSLAEKMAFDIETDRKGSLHEALSDREYQVMCMIAKGKTTKEIAKQFFLSPKTISTYRARTLGKMKMKTNAELIHYAIKHGLVE
jgi:DNA-binding NarL/FixJ family response regulator